MVFCCPGWPANHGLMRKIPPFLNTCIYRNAVYMSNKTLNCNSERIPRSLSERSGDPVLSGLQGASIKISCDRHKEMLKNTPHYKVSQFDNVLMIHVYMCKITFALN